jgi:hypothetical protein
MVRIFRTSIYFISAIIISTAVFAQEGEKIESNPLNEPIAVVKRATYDNFKSIKLLHTSIMNFGGGEAEFDKLVNEYAEASSMFFQDNIPESANIFIKNEKNIQAVALKLAQKYKEDTETLLKDITIINVKNNINLSLKGEKPNATADVLALNGSFGLKKATDYLNRSMPVEAIYYYRRAKENCFKYYEAIGKPLPDRFKKDIVDTHNKVYVAREKEK